MPESKLIELVENLDDAEKAPLTADPPDLLRDVPRTGSPATSFKKLAAKLEEEIASALSTSDVDVGSNAARKVILAKWQLHQVLVALDIERDEGKHEKDY